MVTVRRQRYRNTGRKGLLRYKWASKRWTRLWRTHSSYKRGKQRLNKKFAGFTFNDVRRKLFVNKLIEHQGNINLASRAAGYVNSRRGQGYARLMTDAVVRAELDRRMAKMEITAEEVLTELRAVAMAPWQEFPEHMVQFKGRKVPRIMLNDKVKALELLARYLGLFNKDESQKPQVTIGLIGLQQILTMTPDEVHVLEGLSTRVELLGTGGAQVEEAGPLVTENRIHADTPVHSQVEQSVHNQFEEEDVIEGSYQPISCEEGSPGDD